MKTIMITGPNSNSGKTIISAGILRALKNRGLDISAFKTGPDFIDGKYLGQASGRRAGNLDMHLMGWEGLGQALAMNRGSYGLVEGAMGYFDGIANSYENSSFDIGRQLKIPAILVYTPKGEMFSAVPKIKGMVDFSQGLIKGLILNKTSQASYIMMKEIIEENIDIEVLGFLPQVDDLQVESRSLGLEDSSFEDMDRLLEETGRLIEEAIDLDRLLALMEELEVIPCQYPAKRDIRVAIAYDQAFNFYYQENLSLLDRLCHIEYFSPLKDKTLPQADLIYLGGGYPELFKEELSANRDMIGQIRSRARQGGFILAEGGGFTYLTSSIEGQAMCGVLEGETLMTKSLERFGYVNMELDQDTVLGRKGWVLRGNEYHRSLVKTDQKPLFKIGKPKSTRAWQCGYSFKNTLGYYQHINFLGNMDSLYYLLDEIEKKREEG